LINTPLKEKYGLELTTFLVENVSVPPEVEAAIDKRSSIAAVQNLNDYVKYQIGQGVERGGAGPAGVGAEVAIGMSVAQQLLAQSGGLGGSAASFAGPAASLAGPAAKTSTVSASAAAAAVATPTIEILSPAQVAEILHVKEADVLASLEAGDLKGKRIGSEWRVTRDALDQFLR
jgi:excisionase family DNA binding protein